MDLPSCVAPSLGATSVDIQHVHDRSPAERMCFDGTPEAARIHCLYGDSATFDFSWLKGQVDLLFIDGAHSYEYVRNDTLHAGACCKTGSVIAWHDYGRFGFNGVMRWLHKFAREGNQIYRTPGGSLAYTKLESEVRVESGQGRIAGSR